MDSRNTKLAAVAGGIFLIKRLVAKLAYSPAPQADEASNFDAAYGQQLDRLYQKLVEPKSRPSASEAETKVLSVPE